ncbi:nucleosidase [Kocuria sp. M1R5S2]|uniref:nucleosidase n=1 Tax=Kocuria rhizosphaerae TaxID=3376285 RepID=UPI0037939B6C
MPRLLVLAAHPLETKYFPDDVDLVLTGVGMSAAAVRTTEAVLTRCPDPVLRDELTVLNIGSAGALRDGLSGVHEPSRIINRDVDEELLRAAGIPVDNVIELGGHGLVLATGDSFVAGGAVRDALAVRADLVDMEGWAVAVACRHLGVRLRMVKHVSDAADEAALAWSEKVEVSALALGRWFHDSGITAG